VTLEQNILRNEVDELKIRKLKAEEEIRRVKLEIEERLKNNYFKEDQVNETKSKINNMRLELDKLESQFLSLKEEKTHLEYEKEKIIEEVEKGIVEKDKLKEIQKFKMKAKEGNSAENNEMKKDIEENKEVIEEGNANINLMIVHKNSLSQSYEKFEEELNKQLIEIEKTEVENNEMDKMKEHLVKQIELEKNELDQKYDENIILEENMMNLQSKNNDILSNVERVRFDIENLKTEINQSSTHDDFLKDENNSIIQSLDKYTSSLNNSQDTQRKISQSIYQKRNENDELKEDITELNLKIESLAKRNKEVRINSYRICWNLLLKKMTILKISYIEGIISINLKKDYLLFHKYFLTF